jgi:hypothetical protein
MLTFQLLLPEVPSCAACIRAAGGDTKTVEGSFTTSK